MKKNFLKKLAFTMAFATVFTTLAPAAGVFAAKAPSLTVGKTLTLLLGTERESHDINVNNKVSGSKYAWSTSNKAVATVNSKGIVEGQKVGSAKVTLKITLPTKKTATLSTTVDVKDNIKEVAINNAPKEALTVGQEYDFNRTIVETFGGNTKAHKGAITRWEIVGEEANKVASISDSGVFKATEVGEYEIVAKSFQSKAKYEKYLETKDATLVTATSESVKVKVVASITSIKQLTPTTMEVYFDADMSKVVTKDNLVVEVNDATKQKQIVESVTFADEDAGKKATVKTYLEFKDGVEYKFTVEGNANLANTVVASKGEAKYIKITGPSTVVYGTETPIKYGIYDANDVQIATTGATFEIIDGLANGYEVDGKVTIFEKGKSITLKAKYSTGKVNENTYELIYLEDVVTITATDVIPDVLTSSKYTVAKTAPNWDDFTPKSNIGLGDTGFKVFVQMKVKENGTDVTKTSGFTYASMDESKLIVGNDGELYPFATGTVYVKVSYDKLSVLVPVTIGSERVAATWSFDTTSKTVSNADGVGDTAVFTATIKDNYGSEIKNQTLTVEPLNNAPALLVATPDNKVTFTPVTTNGAETPAKTYQYKVSLGDKLATLITVVVQDGHKDTTVKTWRVEAEATTFDTARTDSNPSAQNVALELFGYNASGIKVKKYATSEYTLDKISGPNMVGTTGDLDGNEFVLTAVSGTAVVSGSTLNNIVKAAKGTYLFEAKLNADNKVVAKTALVVNDTQAVPTVVQKKFTVDAVNGTTTVLDVVRDAFDAFVNGTALNDNRIIDVVYTEVGNTSTTNGVFDENGTSTIVINKIKVAQVFDGTDVVVNEIVVNKSVKVTTAN